MLLLCIAASWASGPPAHKVFTAKDYARAERFMPYNTAPLVYDADVAPAFIGQTDRFWYRVTRKTGTDFMLVDPAKGAKGPAFDRSKLSAALGKASGSKIDPFHLPFATIEFAGDMKSVSFNYREKRYQCSLDSYRCAATGGATTETRGRRGPTVGPSGSPSPDRKSVAFIRDYNLWIRDAATGQETQLTTDGVNDYGYATDNAGWTKSDRPILLWSPDSKKIATFQQDEREVGEMYLVSTAVGHPKLQAWKYPLPGDKTIAMLRRVIVDVSSHRVIGLKVSPDPHRSTLGDDVTGPAGELNDAQWSPDSTKLAFVSTSRDHKIEKLREADAATGEVRDVMQEAVDTQYESGDGRVNWRVLFGSNEYIWYSEKSGYGHLYLGDWQAGRIRSQITNGDWLVQSVLKVDEKNRQIIFTGAGRENGEDPYFSNLYRVGFDGSGLKLLTPETANHTIALSPSGRFFFDGYSTPSTPPVFLLRTTDGRTVAGLEKADIASLIATGWHPPYPIKVKARDGETDLYGLMYLPTKLDPKSRYPIINNIYPGPQGGSVGSRSFSSGRGDLQALAELGFVVVQIDGMGNPSRSKRFHDFYYGNMGDNTLADQVAGMKQLARRYPFIDIDRAGIFGHSGGGFATADAMFRFPDFFKVGISEAGNHDNRDYEDDWAERYQGLLVTNPDGSTNYDNQANQLQAKNLKGRLLLAHGTTDSNVPPYNTLLVVDALIKANKDFDLLMLPNRNHGFGAEPYMVRRRWDYFVRYLLEAEPPKEYQLRPPASSP